MDDIICISNKDSIQSKFENINNLHPALKFTFEKQKDNCLPFLDMLIHNVDGKLSSSWYRKPTDTGLTLNFHSLAPMKYKRSVMIGMVHRIYRACSSWTYIHKGLEEAKLTLLNNQYPLPLIETTFNQTLTHILSENKNKKNDDSILDEIELDPNACIVHVDEKEKFLFFVNYRGKPTEKLANSFKKLNAPCKVIMTLHKTKSTVSSLKANVPYVLQSNVVYKISCPQCKLSYVGQTARHLQQRFREHTGNRGLIKNHFDICGIKPDFNHVEILGRAKGVKLLTLEALFIAEIKPALNTKEEFKSRELKLKF